MTLGKRRVMIILLMLFLSALIIYAIYDRRGAPSYIQKTVDSDTGEILYTEPNKDPEQGGQTREIILLGGAVLIENGLTQQQFELAKELFTSYATNQLKNQYDRLKILPDDLKSSLNKISGSLRLGDSEIILDFEIEYSQLKFVRLIIAGEGNYKFDSGKKTIKSPLPSEAQGAE